MSSLMIPKDKPTNRGAVALSIVFLVSGIAIELAIAGFLVSFAITEKTFSQKIANQAYSAAVAGAEDGIITVIRNCPIGSVAPRCSPSYTFSAADGSIATILVKDDGSNGNKIIISAAVVSGVTKRIQVNLFIDQSTGEVNASVFRECYNYDAAKKECGF